MMKKFLEMICAGMVLSMLCACGQKDADNVDLVTESDVAQDTEENVPVEAVMDITQAAEENTPAEAVLDTMQDTERNVPAEDEWSEEEKIVYEAFLTANPWYCFYVYYDYDQDGKLEFCVCKETDGTSNGRALKYVDGGLMMGWISGKDISGWKEIERIDAAETEKEVQEGVYVYAVQNVYEERHFWYVDEEAFLSHYGFGESAPFYEYVRPDNSTRMVLYYDETTGLGCGLRYYQKDPSESTEFTPSGVDGFSFAGLEEETDLWTDRLNIDYTKFESWDGYTLSSREGIEEIIEYDDAGRVLQYDAYGLAQVGDEEPIQLLHMDYEYDDNGTLRLRRYSHYHLMFSSTCSGYWFSYFDELGRLEYEKTYHTHGFMEYYYIYADESDGPAYGLYLDNCGSCIPMFARIS